MITPEQVMHYREQGYLFLPGLLDAAFVQQLRDEADATLDRMNSHRLKTNYLWQGSWMSDEKRQEQRMDAIHDMQFHSAVFTRLLYHQPLLEAFEALIGPNVQLHHTKLLAKPPKKGGGFPMHQDHPYFPHERHSMMAVSIYLDPADDENGCIRVIPGSHKLGPLTCDPGGLYLPPDKYPLEAGVSCPAQAGDALFFNYLTIHGSAPNTSGRPRRNILIQVRDPQDRPTEEVHISRGQGTMLCGFDPLPIGTHAEEPVAAAKS
jgi:phytanoyl-CoA hydroxylase